MRYRHLLADCGGIQRRSGIGSIIMGIVRILGSERARIIVGWMTVIRKRLRPGLRQRRSMDRWTIHESKCSGKGKNNG